MTVPQFKFQEKKEAERDGSHWQDKCRASQQAVTRTGDGCEVLIRQGKTYSDRDGELTNEA